jgi:hypothetical protein
VAELVGHDRQEVDVSPRGAPLGGDHFARRARVTECLAVHRGGVHEPAKAVGIPVEIDCPRRGQANISAGQVGDPKGDVLQLTQLGRADARGRPERDRRVDHGRQLLAGQRRGLRRRGHACREDRRQDELRLGTQVDDEDDAVGRGYQELAGNVE